MTLHTPSAHVALHATECLAAISSALQSAEYLAERRFLHPGHPLFAERHPNPRVDWTLHRPALNWFLSYSVAVLLLAGKLILAILVLASVVHPYSVLVPRVTLSGILVFTILWHLRGRALLRASDQFALMCLLPSAAAEWIATSTADQTALLFIAALSALCYGSAGFLKLRERGWRDGSFLRYVLSTRANGQLQWLRKLRRRPSLLATLSVAGVGTECLLCVAALLPPSLCLAALASGVLLHLVIARVMGLGAYVWAFSAAYPAVFYVSCRIYRA